MVFVTPENTTILCKTKHGNQEGLVRLIAVEFECQEHNENL